MPRITIKDIAKDLNISTSTVSRGLAGDKCISDETKRRIAESAKRLGYQRNSIAATLRSGRTNTIGIIVNEMNTPLSGQLVAGVQDFLKEKGIGVLIANSNNDPAMELANLKMFLNRLVDGLIVMLCDKSTNISEFQQALNQGTPVVFCDSLADSHSDSDHVISNHLNKAFFLVDHLIHSGRKRVVHLKGRSILPKYEMLLHAYRDALRKYNMKYDPELVLETEITGQGGRDAIDLLLDRNVNFDTVFACHDYVAVGAMNRLRERGIKVPDQVAVAGYSGSELSTMVYPQLTTVETPMSAMGHEAARIILNKLRNPDTKPQTVVIDGRILLRNSSHDILP